MKYDINTNSKSVEKDFSSQFSSLASDNIKSSSKYGRYFIINGDKVGGGHGAARWDSVTDTLGPIINTQNEVAISPNGDYILELGQRGVDGIRCFDATTGNLVKILDIDANYPHSDVLKDSNGTQWIVYQYSAEGKLRKVSIPDGKIYDLLDERYLNYHISARQSTGDWVIVSFFTSQGQRDDGPDFLEDEIVRVFLDSTPQNPHVERMVHHRSRALGAGGTYCYWKQPHASVSPDGKFAMFESSWGDDCVAGTDIVDPYVLSLSPSETPNDDDKPNSPTGFRMTILGQ